MKTGTINVTIEGISGLLMNKFNVAEAIEQKKGRRTTRSYDPVEDAEKSAYWSSKGKKELIIPSQVIYASLLNASSFHKIGRRSAKAILAGSIRVDPSEISLGTDKYEVDIRPVVIQRARVIKGRAILPEWKASFKIIYNKDLIADEQIIKTILEEAGQRIGIMDFRPQKGGQYGTFKVIKFKSE